MPLVRVLGLSLLLLPPILMQKLLVVVAADVKKLVVVIFCGPCSIILSHSCHCLMQVRTLIDGKIDDNSDRSSKLMTTIVIKARIWRKRLKKLKLDDNDNKNSRLTTTMTKSNVEEKQTDKYKLSQKFHWNE